MADVKEVDIKLSELEPLVQQQLANREVVRRSDKPTLHRTLSNGSTTRYPLITEGDVLLCRIIHHRSLLQKIIYSSMLRRWETHKIVLSDNHLHSYSVSL